MSSAIHRLDVARAIKERGWRKLTPLERDLLAYASQVRVHGQKWAAEQAQRAYHAHRANGLSESEAFGVTLRANTGFIQHDRLRAALNAAIRAERARTPPQHGRFGFRPFARQQ